MNSNLVLSKYNIFSKLKDSSDHFIVNILSGNADILTESKAEELKKGHFSHVEEYLEKGYLVDPKEEEKRYKLKYLEFLQQRDTDEIQIFFVPHFACNFNCSYCYQADYESDPIPLKKEVVDAFYHYVDHEFSWRRKYITLFGGEPLLNSPHSRLTLEWMLTGAMERRLETAIVTNGYWLAEHIDILKKGHIREVQVTLDGTEEIHDARRQLKDGAPTFNRIVAGIDAALENNIPINLRVVVDKENVDNMKDLASFAMKKRWTKYPHFKTQLGRNYELHTCGVDQNRLFSRISMYEALYKMIKDYPEFLEFHRPAFSIARFLFENSALPDPLFDSCPGTKTEWAFDYQGNIYACTATVGKKGEELGTFYPKISKKEDMIALWEERDVASIPACKDCAVQLACGGGCAAVAKNKSGDIFAPDCRPIKELLEMGLSLYFNEAQTTT